MASFWGPLNNLPELNLRERFVYFFGGKYQEQCLTLFRHFHNLPNHVLLYLTRRQTLLPYCLYSFIWCTFSLCFVSDVDLFCWGIVGWLCSKRLTQFRVCLLWVIRYINSCTSQTYLFHHAPKNNCITEMSICGKHFYRVKISVKGFRKMNVNAMRVVKMNIVVGIYIGWKVV